MIKKHPKGCFFSDVFANAKVVETFPTLAGIEKSFIK